MADSVIASAIAVLLVFPIPPLGQPAFLGQGLGAVGPVVVIGIVTDALMLLALHVKVVGLGRPFGGSLWELAHGRRQAVVG